MPRFFTGQPQGDTLVITGEDARHIARVLRMQPGESLTACDGSGMDYDCVICSAAPDQVVLQVQSAGPSRSEPRAQVTVFQGLPKGEKMELIVQKSVELGARAIQPVLMSRSVSRPDGKAAAAKMQRWQRIALEAAKQSGRGRIPQVLPLVDFDTALARLEEYDTRILLYEKGGEPLSRVLGQSPCRQIAALIGPEGGFAPEEAQAAQAAGCRAVYLGRRILRCETAPLCLLSALMYHTGDLE